MCVCVQHTNTQHLQRHQDDARANVHAPYTQRQRCSPSDCKHTHIFHFITSLVCDDGDKTVVTEMSVEEKEEEEGGGESEGFEIEREIMHFN